MKPAVGAAIIAAMSLSGCASPPDASAPAATAETRPQSPLDERIAHYAEVYDVPEELIRRSIRRESGYNPKARNGPYWGLMQIRVDTARGLGYRGVGRGLLDADTNLKYAAAYLANAYRVSGGDLGRAIALYAHGYYYEARRKGVSGKLIKVAEEQPAPDAGGSDLRAAANEAPQH